MVSADAINTALDVLDEVQVRHAIKEVLTAPDNPGQRGALASSLGVDSEQIVRLATSVAAIEAVPLPFAHLLEGQPCAWYRLGTPALNELVAIAAQTCETSPLSASMRRHISHGNFIRPYIDEVRAGFAHDGIELDYDLLQDLVRGNRPVMRAEERAFLNTYTLMVEIAEAGHADCSASALLGYVERIGDGCAGIGSLSGSANDAAIRDISVVLEDLRALACGPQDVLVGAIMAAVVIWETRPFSAFNGVMEVLVWMLFGMQGGYPALSCVPFSLYDMRGDGIDGQRTPLVAVAQQTPYGLDASHFIRQQLGVVRQGLHDLERSLFALDSRDDTVLQQLESDFRLNHRQRTTMMLAAADATFAIDVADYGNAHDVAVATARADLQKLVELDYLFRDHEGSRVVYHVRPDLQAKVEAFAKKGTAK